MSNDDWGMVAAAILALAVPPSILFPLLYLKFPWYKSPVGIMLMLSSFGMFLLVVLAATFRVLEYEAPNVIRAFVYAIITGGLWFQSFLLVRAYLRNLRTRKQSRIY